MTLPSVSISQAGVKHVLAFDGLDTYATVRLNGSTILESDNMFVMHRVDVTHKLDHKNDNVLEIEFASALVESRRLKDAHPGHKWVGSNGDMARLAARKAQYHYGWDWGPILLTCGPWRSVRLESYQARIEDVRVDYEVDTSLSRVRGRITACIEESSGQRVRIEARLDNVEVFKAITDVDSDGNATLEFHIPQAKLWYPRGYGEQNLYTVRAILIDGQHDLHSVSRRIGFRKGELIQDSDKFGTSFHFRFNGIDIFCGGSNWIPADSFTPRITNSTYYAWLEMLAAGNQVMVRVWGGGIWEEDVFYDICDELGIFVWQDFMFACGNYPAYPEMLKSIEAEAVCQTKRLRHHPCIAIYAGNNEDYQIREQFDLTYNVDDPDSKSWLKTDFPARYIYEKLLPEVVATQSPHVPYHPGSPWSKDKPSSDPGVGDLHQWNVWHGTQEKYQVFDTLGGRFVSEFGLEAFPHIETIKSFVANKTQLYPQSRVIDFHNKAAGHERRIATYLAENFRMQTDPERFIHLTQLSQAEAMTFAYRGWRRQWGQGRRCGGALVWQLNDCWPVTSWSIVDYYLRKKPAYYAIKRALAPMAVALKREHHDWSVAGARPPKSSKYECWVSSNRTRDILADVELRFVSIATGSGIRDKIEMKKIRVLANGTTELLKGTIDNTTQEPHVLSARLWVDGKLVSRDIDWPQPLKYLDLNERGLEVVETGDVIKVSARRPTKGIVFQERNDVVLSDNGIDVVPGDAHEITVRGPRRGVGELKWTWLGAP